jgi:hypothetical protein
LSWAKVLGVKDVPTISATTRSQMHLINLVGSPTVKKEAGGGNVFYLNSVGHAISKVSLTPVFSAAHGTGLKSPMQDYANPITRLTMQDYPEDSGHGMSQVFNGTKMLFDLPSDIVAPAAKNRGRIFYVNELLQDDRGTYFIPQRYFYGPVDPQDRLSTRVLYALGWNAERTQVCHLIPFCC